MNYGVCCGNVPVLGILRHVDGMCMYGSSLHIAFCTVGKEPYLGLVQTCQKQR